MKTKAQLEESDLLKDSPIGTVQSALVWDVNKKYTFICVKELKFENVSVIAAKPSLALVNTKIGMKVRCCH